MELTWEAIGSASDGLFLDCISLRNRLNNHLSWLRLMAKGHVVTSRIVFCFLLANPPAWFSLIKWHLLFMVLNYLLFLIIFIEPLNFMEHFAHFVFGLCVSIWSTTWATTQVCLLFLVSALSLISICLFIF